MKTTLLTSLLVAGAMAINAAETADAKAPVHRKDQLSPLSAGNVKLTGHIGQKIDTIIAARYTSEFALAKIRNAAVSGE